MDKTLQPCINYWCLNDITDKNYYPLSLISSAFELLQRAMVFSKLDLQNAHRSVCRRGMSGSQCSRQRQATMSASSSHLD